MSDSNPYSEYTDERDGEAFWAAIEPADEPMRHRWFLPAVIGVIALSIPWYLPHSFGNQMIGGLPLWTWITLACSVGLSSVTAYASLRLWRNAARDASADAGDET